MAPDRQSFRELPPDRRLARVISCTWVQQVAGDAATYIHRAVAHASVELIWRVGSPPALRGPRTGPLIEVLAPGTTQVGVRFRPAAGQVLGMPASELADLTVECEAVWGSTAGLEERLAATPRWEAALGVLQDLVVARLGPGSPLDPLVESAVERMPWHAGDVSALTSSLHISERQFRRRCQDAVGLPPKMLHRVQRFQGFLALAQVALAQRRPAGEEGLARLAAELGYADQAHLTRESRRLSGLAPRVFLDDLEHRCGGDHEHAISLAPLLGARRL